MILKVTVLHHNSLVLIFHSYYSVVGRKFVSKQTVAPARIVYQVDKRIGTGGVQKK